jgi:hypothetical protein
MTPFELRAEMLKMAETYLQRQYDVSKEIALSTFDNMVRIGNAKPDDWRLYIPTMYSIEEITKKAAELYGFVQEKK